MINGDGTGHGAPLVRRWWRAQLVFLLFLCCGQLWPLEAQAQQDAAVQAQLTVGAKDYTENLLIGKLLVLLLREAGYTVGEQTDLGGAVAVRQALATNVIDLYAESSATALSLYHHLPLDALPDDHSRSYQLAKRLDEDNELVWLDPYGYNSSLVLLAAPTLADQGVESLDDLAAQLRLDSTIKLCAWDEFYGRPQGGLAALQATYNLPFQEENIFITDYEETLRGLQTGRCAVAVGLLTDSRIDTWRLTVLRDPRAFFAVDVTAPVLRQSLLAADPALADVINQLSPHLAQETLRQLTARIDLGADGESDSGDEEALETVAQDFLRTVGLMKLPTLVVGSKEYTSSILLGKMMVHLLREAGYEVIDETGYGGTFAIRAALEQGKIDLYAESSGTALSLFHALPAAAQPDESRRSYELARALDAENNIIWLEPTRYNDKLVVVVGNTLAGQQIASLADLARVAGRDATAVTLCTWDEFYGRAQGGLAALLDGYGLPLAEENIFIADLDATFQALREGRCTAAVVPQTDGRIAAWQLQPLADPLAFFPIDIPAPTIRASVLQENPKVADVLHALGQFLTDEIIQELSAQVDIGADGELTTGDEEAVDVVAEHFLQSHRLVKLPPLTVGSSTASEPLLLGRMLVFVLQDAGYAVSDKTGLGDDRAVRQALETGEIDLYVGSSATALVLAHGLPGTAIPTDAKRTYALVKNLDGRKGFVWLPAHVDTSVYSLLVRDEMWQAGVQSISDLVARAADRDQPFTICVTNSALAGNVDGLGILATGYQLTFAADHRLPVTADAAYAALRLADCDVAEGDARDSRVAAWNLHVLADPLALFPATNLAPVVRKPVSETNPDLDALLTPLVSLLTDDTMRTLNERAMIGPDGELFTGDEEPVQTIAQAFLLEAGLITVSVPATTTAPATP